MEALWGIIFGNPRLAKVAGSLLMSLATAQTALGLRFARLDLRMARRGLNIDLVSSLPWWMEWAVPRSIFGWIWVVLLFVAGAATYREAKKLQRLGL